MADDRQIRVEEDGQVLAQAVVSAADETGEAHAQVHVASGHLPIGTRRKMADAVHEAVVDDSERLSASVPLGDTELVEGLREHLTEVELRAAGATSIVRGHLKPR